MRATVYNGINNIYRVRSAEGESECLELECRIKGKILEDEENAYNPLAPGDSVECERVDSRRGMIIRRHDRINRFARWNRKRGAWQIVAANLDLAAAVISASEPPFRPRFVDRVLIAAAQGGVTGAVVVNKIDLGIDSWVQERLDAWRAMGIDVRRCSAADGTGLNELAAAWKGCTAALFGPSGVGKSTLINRLIPGLELPTLAVSKKYNRGRHATNFGRMIDAPWGGRIVDTPGVREITVKGIPSDELSGWFPDFDAFAPLCMFQPCLHRSEPGCAVRRGVEDGDIHRDRYESYLRILKWLEGLEGRSPLGAVPL